MWFDVANRTTVPLARWDDQALHLLWKEGASVVINFTIRDSTSDAGDVSPEVGPARSGIFFADGRPKARLHRLSFPVRTTKLPLRGKQRLRAKVAGERSLVMPSA